jgi:hypothetical protein
MKRWRTEFEWDPTFRFYPGWEANPMHSLDESEKKAMALLKEFIDMFQKIEVIFDECVSGEYDNNFNPRISRAPEYPGDERTYEKFSFGYNKGVKYKTNEDRILRFLHCLMADYSYNDDDEAIGMMLPIDSVEQYYKTQELIAELKKSRRKIDKIFTKEEIEVMQKIFEGY